MGDAMLALPYIGVVNPAIIAQGHGMSLVLCLQKPALHRDGTVEIVGLVIQHDGTVGRTMHQQVSLSAQLVIHQQLPTGAAESPGSVHCVQCLRGTHGSIVDHFSGFRAYMQSLVVAEVELRAIRRKRQRAGGRRIQAVQEVTGASFMRRNPAIRLDFPLVAAHISK